MKTSPKAGADGLQSARRVGGGEGSSPTGAAQPPATKGRLSSPLFSAAPQPPLQGNSAATRRRQAAPPKRAQDTAGDQPAPTPSPGQGQPAVATVLEATGGRDAADQHLSQVMTMMLTNQAHLREQQITMELANSMVESGGKAVSMAVQCIKDGIGNAAKAAEKIP
jgi:hypothetical protein